MSGPFATEIGDALLEDELAREALVAWSEDIGVDLPACVVWLVKEGLAQSGRAYIETRPTVEFLPGKRLKERPARARPATPRRPRKGLTLVCEGADGKG